ncbi:MAG TPA: GNAT family protein [Dehalococcoidia bacterium]|jgi:RimJ/RimL family protein N-acetyltransferase|nr:GNAT family protein [Dehalococcoidia bacterium]
MTPIDPRPVTLGGRYVRLEPLGPQHFESLLEVAANRGIFRYFPVQIESPEEVRTYLGHCVAQMESGAGVTFTTVSLADERPVGGTSFLAIDRLNRRLEIGGTWIAPEWQRTACNTEAKYLQLRHCFEELGCIRVEFKTDSLNERSRAALARIGAVEEGTFRNHMIVQPSGRYRHSVYFSVIESEWPDVKARLEAKLA